MKRKPTLRPAGPGGPAEPGSPLLPLLPSSPLGPGGPAGPAAPYFRQTRKKRRNQMLHCRCYQALFIETTFTCCHTYRFTLVTAFSLGTSRAWFTLESKTKRDHRIKHHSKNLTSIWTFFSCIKMFFNHPIPCLLLV